jgi:hypothetical protein
MKPLKPPRSGQSAGIKAGLLFWLIGAPIPIVLIALLWGSCN